MHIPNPEQQIQQVDNGHRVNIMYTAPQVYYCYTFHPVDMHMGLLNAHSTHNEHIHRTAVTG